MSFADLERDPVGQLRRTYDTLGLEEFERLAPKLEREVAALTGYRKNVFSPLDPALQRKVVRAWRRSFEEWDYPLPDESIA